MGGRVQRVSIHWFSLILGGLGGMVLGVLLGYVWVFRAPSLVLEVPTPLPLPPTATPAPVTVYVSGAVNNPGVYTLPAFSRVADAVRAAGGVTEHADKDAVNLALPLEDGTHVHVPRVGEVPGKGEKAHQREGASGAVTFPVDVNTAPPAALEAIPGIGRVMAQRIVAHRPYGTVEDLLRVPGIGPATLEKLRPYVKVGTVPQNGRE